MVYRFRLISDETDLFCREIVIDSEALFIDLHQAILDCVDYDKNLLTSFFICNENWEKETEITLIEMDTDPEIDSWVMDSTHLDELLDEEGQRMVYIFDNLAERAFFIELVEIQPNKHLCAAQCTFKKGKAPKQSYDFDEIDKKIALQSKKVSIDDDDEDNEFYGDRDFDIDELDADGFGDLEGFGDVSALDDY